jgi:TetR/AcrR family transcriptional regulator
MDLAPADQPAWQHRSLDRSLGSIRERQAARAHALIRAARGLAGERDSVDFTVGEVAQRAGVPVRSFYRQFSGKDELLVALLEEEARQGADLLAEAMADLDAPLARLERYIVGLWTLMAAGSGYTSVLVREHLRLGERRPKDLRQALEPLVSLLRTTLDDAAAKGDVRPIDTNEAVLIFSTILAHVHAAILFVPEEAPGGSAEALWKFWKLALAPDSSRH